MEILYRGMLSTYHSWAQVGRELCFALDKLGHKVSAINSDRFSYYPVKKLEKFLKTPQTDNVVLTYTIPPNFSLKLQKFKIKLSIYNYETTIMPPRWAEFCNKYLDCLLPSSNFAKQIFLKNGVEENKLEVIPHGVNTFIFNPHINPTKYSDSKFKFVTIVSDHKRKGIDLVAEAFIESFSDKDDVCWILKTNHAENKRKMHFTVEPQEIINRLKRKKENPPKIIHISERIDNIASLINEGNVFVSASRSECFCLPTLESLACGKPIIVTGYGGQTDFLNNDNSYLIDYKVRIAKSIENYWHFPENAEIAEPSVEHLCHLMKYVYNNYQEALEKVKRGQEVVKKYSWENAAQKIVNVIEKIKKEKNVQF